jgi:hypothetical protein
MTTPVSIKQQVYALLAAALTGYHGYGSDNGTDSDAPPPAQGAPVPWWYLRLGDEFSLSSLSLDKRAILQVRFGDSERAGYGRITAGLALAETVLAPKRAFLLTDSGTSEIIWRIDPASWSGETEDPDRPGTLLRWGEWAMRKMVRAAAVAAVAR